MREQTFYLENFNSFEPKHIFECGQCFRWDLQPDGSYTGIFGKNVLNVKKENEKIVFKGICETNIIKTCMDYFDLNRDYNKIKEKLALVDDNLSQSIEYGYGIRILKQDLWETIISFIISANNNIPRIKGIIDRISKEYGQPIEYDGNIHYTFPTPQELSKATIEDLRRLGLGFRDKYVYNTTQMIINSELISVLEKEKDINIIKENLMQLPGIGEKVADCIILFGLNRFESFPVDVWVRRVMNELYIKNKDEAKVKNQEIRKLAYAKYDDLAGIAQQYLFYWKREA